MEVHDIFVVPDYAMILNECGDNSFNTYSKGANTQHQFIFEAVETSEYFPLGVKVSYRAYSQDSVFEIVTDNNGTGEATVTVQECQVSTFPKEKKLVQGSQTTMIPAGEKTNRPIPN